MKLIYPAAIAAVLFFSIVMRAAEIELASPADPQAFALSDAHGTVGITVDPGDYEVVHVAAGLFADDVQRVTGRRPAVTADAKAPEELIVGTLGHSALIDRLAAEGKLKDLEKIKGRWEATLWQIVDSPLPGVRRALVIAGSDRRGAAYGLMVLSEKIGVSPWYWWADVPARQSTDVAVTIAGPLVDAPAVKFRGIFINDEDWGMNPWASKTFEPNLGNIGPKTYAKVFELLLRLRLNYIWPAMHACTAEFASQPENFALADKFGIVAGSSHCEPMLCNNVHWNEKTQGKWDYTVNRDAIHSYWADSAKTRGNDEAVWTLGIRGIHDAAMEGPREIPTRIKIVSQVIADQRALLDRYVTKQWGPVAQCFVPYKEVLPIYDAGLSVPDDVTLVWVDDNFGYIRRLSAPAERKRAGGAGVYWHLSYYGGPHSYTWIETTAPALIWEELHKAWENDARTLWVINVGDLKPAEVGIDFYARLAWRADALGPKCQPEFLGRFAERNFGAPLAPAIAGLLGDYYRLGTIRKPELMVRSWAISLRDDEAAQLESEYRDVLRRAEALGAQASSAQHDAFVELVGFPTRVLADTGLIFLADRQAQLGNDVAQNEQEIARLRADLEAAVANYNTEIAGGKWNRMMPGLVTGADLMKWSSQVRWPWGERATSAAAKSARASAAAEPPAGQGWRPAAQFDRARSAGRAAWVGVPGLGGTGRALVLLPAGSEAPWSTEHTQAPEVEYDFNSTGGSAAAFIDFLPTFRIYPGMLLRVSIAVDDRPLKDVEVPGSNGKEDERGAIRQAAVQDNYVRVRFPLSDLSPGKHRFIIQAIDPGVVIDRVSLP